MTIGVSAAATNPQVSSRVFRLLLEVGSRRVDAHVWALLIDPNSAAKGQLSFWLFKGRKRQKTNEDRVKEAER